MSKFAIFTKEVITPETVVPQGVVLVEGNKILEVGTRFSVNFNSSEFETLHFEQKTLVPGFIDVHIHGGRGRDVMEGTREAIEVVSRHLAVHGTTAYLATTVTASPIATIQAVESLGKLIPEETGGARILGLHLEGPFISQEKRGVHPPEHIRPPSRRIFDELVKMSNNQVRLITVAPESPGGLEFIQHIRSKGVLVSLGHSNATCEVAREAIQVGASNATHTFNAMRDFNHRQPGVLGAVLTDSRVWAELIADGAHVDPVAIQMLLKCKGHRRILLVTDAISAAGMPDGDFQLGSLAVKVSQGVCRSPEGALAGSTLSLDQALRNMVSWTGIPLEEAVYMASRNPAESIGVAGTKGSIQPGYDADMVLLNDDLHVHATFCDGKLVHQSPE
ncbi:MAG: N-acetylglucosamine-6-phosphate deacetylase [Acidobacteria bacterium]|nr:N-acetylglucosamine-6-phosphate deacetylase [Acidobacteriota bacterium]MCI0622933.1 N-acetylglucosamine-6-phosphate deacetylase [Acidobacteriota bacterium]MCI0719992.1 N-acetylglucosamine-6-phosphate deacetylase [Acidobacteriota bacterium]